MKILIIGLGSIGTRHLKNLAALGVADLSVLTSGHSTLLPEKLPPFRREQHLHEALGRQPDAVFICNPTSLHLETALAAAQAGCHIFLEKPVSHSLLGLDELAALVGQNDLQLQVGFQYRYHVVFQRIKAALQEGMVGQPVAGHAHWSEYLPDWHPWEDYRRSYSARADLGGGVTLTLCHPFDYLRWMLGEVETVAAIGGRLSGLDLDTEDAMLVSLRFENRTIGSVWLDYAGRPPRHTLQIIGTEGRIEWDADGGSAKIFSQGGRVVEVVPPGLFSDRNEMFLAEVADFMDCLQHGRPVKCNLHDGRRALEIAVAAKKHALAFAPEHRQASRAGLEPTAA